MSKVAIKGADTGTGVFTLESPATNTDRTLVLPDEAGTIDTLQRAGNVLQVVQGSTSVQVNTTSATFIDTGLSVSITPSSASSKVFVMAVHQGCGKYSANNSLALNLLRDSTQIHTGGTKGVNSNDAGESWVGSYTLSYLDSPSTTSAVTYKTQLSNVTGSGTVRVQSSDGVSTIVAMEIAA